MRNEFEIRGEITAILIRRKKSPCLEAIIDTVDLPIVLRLDVRWCVTTAKGTKTLYVISNKTERDPVKRLLHRELMGVEDDKQVDHFDHDGLNNRRNNLVVCTQSVNQLNRSGARKDSHSGIRGVMWQKRIRRWVAEVQVEGKRNYLGVWKHKEDAAEVVGNFLRINHIQSQG